MAILEIACGSGSLLHWLKTRGYEDSFGIDICSKSIAIANSLGLKVKCADAIDFLMNQSSQSLDVIFALDFYEHLNKREFLQFLRECERILLKGGRLILRGPNGSSPVVGCALFNDITHQWAITPIALEALSKNYGYKSLQTAEDRFLLANKDKALAIIAGKLFARIIRALIQVVTGERISHLSASIYMCLTKA